MKQNSQLFDYSFQRNEQHVLSDILEYAFIIAITIIAIIAAAFILNEQISVLV